MTERAYNFGAGPATLPTEVLEEAQGELLNFQGTGMSVAETSHRAKSFTSVIEQTEADIRELMSISDNYDVMFLQGGASGQFAMLPMNLVGEGDSINLVDTGMWSKKAMAAAKTFGNVHVAASSKDANYNYVPDSFDWADNTVYTHLTSNNTIFGTQMQAYPDTPSPKVMDMSSDIMSAPINVDDFGVIYAGAQKNIGPSGVALVIMRKDLTERCANSYTPDFYKYKTHADAGSLYNTPPTFSIYVIGLVMKWLKGKGGLAGIQKINEDKGAVLYNAIENSGGFYTAAAKEGSRSLMNVTFTLPSEDLDKVFLAESDAIGLKALKGHRSVGGMRASIYNAMPAEGVQALADFMGDFAKKNG